MELRPVVHLVRSSTQRVKSTSLTKLIIIDYKKEEKGNNNT